MGILGRKDGGGEDSAGSDFVCGNGPVLASS